MKKSNLALALASLSFATAALAGGEGMTVSTRPWGGGNSSVVISGNTNAYANGGRTAVFGETMINGTHTGVNGTTKFFGDNGFEASGVGSSNGQSALGYSELRGRFGGSPHMYSPDHTVGGRSGGERTSFVYNTGDMSSNANGGDGTRVFGVMDTEGVLNGFRSDSTKWNQTHGYEATGTTYSNGSSSGNYYQVYQTSGRVHVGSRP